ncbi:hypothetical protein [Streptomyces halobius]|uniref:Uncharacterized protein n=1 Tax=Streptomyces halobius TaxID=2879846 RepID=A0ABY4M3M9_9ACTN|nr:hypothetical protein [Streptomyces halobius]UQA92367.1 hypothetical protein K9S39_11425 [Streptomyces halobius]
MILPRVRRRLDPAVGLVVAATETFLVISRHRAGTAMTVSSPPSLLDLFPAIDRDDASTGRGDGGPGSTGEVRT